MSVDFQLLLEYLKVFLAWPVVTLASIIFVCLLFKAPLSQWLSNLCIKYGGAEVFALRQQRTDTKETSITTSPVSAKAEITQTDDKKAEATIDFPKEIEELRNLVSQYRTSSYVWEYRYLNLFLVYNSKRVLTWLADLNQPISVEVAAAIWTDQFPVDQRNTIVEVLQRHSLILVDTTGKTIQATPKGREFIDYIGRVPVGNLVPPA